MHVLKNRTTVVYLLEFLLGYFQLTQNNHWKQKDLKYRFAWESFSREKVLKEQVQTRGHDSRLRAIDRCIGMDGSQELGWMWDCSRSRCQRYPIPLGCGWSDIDADLPILSFSCSMHHQSSLFFLCPETKQHLNRRSRLISSLHLKPIVMVHSRIAENVISHCSFAL